MKRILMLAGTLTLTQVANSETKLKEVSVNEVYEEDGHLVVETENGVRRIKMTDALKNELNFEIKIHDRKLIEGEDKVIRRSLTLEERSELRKTIVEARKLYKEKNYTQAWDKVNLGQKIDPWNVTLLNMKGSILYVTGSEQLALDHWKKSLEVKPKQDRLTKLVRKVEAKLNKESKIGTKPQTPQMGKATGTKRSESKPARKRGNS